MDKIKIGLIIAAYLMVVILGFNWGIPNEHRVFTYHMDEWHQLSSVKALAKYGTPNRQGAAHGPILFFLSSGIWFKALAILNVIKPEQVTSSITNLDLQHNIFWWARFSILIYGVFSILTMSWILQMLQVKLKNWWLAIFSFSPGFIIYSGYYKYDIALLFYILLTIGCIIKLWQTKYETWWVSSWVAGALALSTKLAAAPIFIWLIIVGIVFKIKNLRVWELAISAAILIFCLVGIPDVFMGKADYWEFLSSNLISNPNILTQSNISSAWLWWVLIEFWPAVIGRALAICTVWLVFFWLRKTSNKLVWLAFIGMGLFSFSVLGLKIAGIGNRVLVVLPWIIIFAASVFEQVKFAPKLAKAVLITILFFQVVETGIWQKNRYTIDIRESSSSWLLNNIRPGVTIGVEESVIYEMLPDLVEKEWFWQQENIGQRSFVYNQVSSNSQSDELPAVVIVSNTNWANIFSKSTKAQLLARLKLESYRPVVEFKSPIPTWLLSENAQSLEPKVLAVPTDIKIFIRDNTVLNYD